MVTLMLRPRRMSSSPCKKLPDVVADRVLKRAEISKMARRLQNRLALAQFKTQHGWEDLTLDSIEPKVEEEMRRRRAAAAAAAAAASAWADGDAISDSSSSVSDLPYPSRALMSSPFKATLFSDRLGSSSGGSTGHRKRTYDMLAPHSATAATFLDAHHDSLLSSPSKRFRASGHRGSFPSHATFSQQQLEQRQQQQHPHHHHTVAPNPPFGQPSSANGSSASWKHQYQLAQSSPIKPCRQPHFTTSAGPDLSFFAGASAHVADDLTSPPTRAATSDEEDDLLPAYSFRPSSGSNHNVLQSSPPTTPPPATPPPPSRRNPSNMRRSGSHAADTDEKESQQLGGGEPGPGPVPSATDIRTGQEGADLLLFLAASPSPANPKRQLLQLQQHQEAGAARPATTTTASMASAISLMEPPSTPPPRGSKMSLPSAMMTTPGGNPFLSTPNLGFDFADFVHMTPSPAQKPWKTPVAKTPLSAARRRLTFDDM